MSVRQLPEPMDVWRIGDPAGRYAIYSGIGASMQEGRWHNKGQDPIYTCEHYGTAMLEKLVHYNGVLPPNQHFLVVSIPQGISYETVTKDKLSGWHDEDCTVARGFGSQWFDETRSCLLLVPSVVSREERNVIINPNHADFPLLKPGLEEPVHWDNRLFSP